MIGLQIVCENDADADTDANDNNIISRATMRMTMTSMMSIMMMTLMVMMMRRMVMMMTTCSRKLQYRQDLFGRRCRKDKQGHNRHSWKMLILIDMMIMCKKTSVFCGLYRYYEFFMMVLASNVCFISCYEIFMIQLSMCQPKNIENQHNLIIAFTIEYVTFITSAKNLMHFKASHLIRLHASSLLIC